MGGRRASKIRKDKNDPNRRKHNNKYSGQAEKAQERILREREETKTLETSQAINEHTPITTEEFYFIVGTDLYQRKDAVTNELAFSLEEVTALIPQVEAAKKLYLNIYGENPNPRALLVEIPKQNPFYVQLSKNSNGGIYVGLFVRRSYRTRYLARPNSLESLSSTGIAVLD